MDGVWDAHGFRYPHGGGVLEQVPPQIKKDYYILTQNDSIFPHSKQKKMIKDSCRNFFKKTIKKARESKHKFSIVMNSGVSGKADVNIFSLSF